jgi:hypothetical protein
MFFFLNRGPKGSTTPRFLLFIHSMTDDLTRFPDETECLKTQDMYEIVIKNIFATISQLA